MQDEATIESTTTRARRPGFFTRYRGLLRSRETIFAAINAVLLLAGLFSSVAGAPALGKWLYFASAVIGGTPLLLFTARNVFVNHDITAGVMASVAIIAAIIVGEYSAAALVVFMFAIGDWLENLTIARANNALKDLSTLIPATVTVRRDGQDQSVPVEQVRSGDLVLVRSGERIAVDGVVLSGMGSVDQSTITGESVLVEKVAGDEVYAGTLNELGVLEVRVDRVGAETVLGQIVRLVKDAQASQAPVQRIANRYARILVPVTFGIAILVYLLTGDILRSVTILVVVCPCALVLATPTAVAAAIGNAAKRGILVKTGSVMEQVGGVDLVAFDKTGTLTYGKPSVQQVLPLGGMSAESLLGMAAAVEQYSEHPIGRSIVAAGPLMGADLAGSVEGFTPLTGYGVTARVDDHEVVIGRPSLLSEREILLDEAAERAIETWETRGHTVIALAVDGVLGGLITLLDSPRSEAGSAISELKSLGIDVALISGDNERAARQIGAQLGVGQVYSQVLPQDKLRILRDLQAAGKRVAFVGDGVNDAPALAAADVGIAMGIAGTDVALETASIGLMTDELGQLARIVDLSRRTMRVIRQNVVFSMSMNVLAVVLSGLGIIGPAVGALAHEFGALPVLINSARLIGYGRAVSGRSGSGSREG